MLRKTESLYWTLSLFLQALSPRQDFPNFNRLPWHRDLAVTSFVNNITHVTSYHTSGEIQLEDSQSVPGMRFLNSRVALNASANYLQFCASEKAGMLLENVTQISGSVIFNFIWQMELK